MLTAVKSLLALFALRFLVDCLQSMHDCSVATWFPTSFLPLAEDKTYIQPRLHIVTPIDIDSHTIDADSPVTFCVQSQL